MNHILSSQHLQQHSNLSTSLYLDEPQRPWDHMRKNGFHNQMHHFISDLAGEEPSDEIVEPMQEKSKNKRSCKILPGLGTLQVRRGLACLLIGRLASEPALIGIDVLKHCTDSRHQRAKVCDERDQNVRCCGLRRRDNVAEEVEISLRVESVRGQSFPIEITVMCFSEGAMEDAGSRRVQPLARPRSQLGALSGLIRANRGPRRPQRFSHQGA
ncbi:uncharacterized [Tachysurus ichikawai]